MALKNILPQSKPPPGIAFVKQPGTGTGKKKGSATGSEDSEEYDDSDIPPNEIPTPMSFLQKYWYIILPMVLMQFLAVEEEQQPAQQQGQQQQGAGQNSGGTIAPAAASGQKMRRGKTSKSKNN